MKCLFTIRTTFYSIALASVLLFSCKKEDQNGELANNAELAATLKATPATVSLHGYNIKLVATAVRDMMPTVGGRNNRLFSQSVLTELNGAALSKEFKLVNQYLVKGDEVFRDSFTEVRFPSPNTLEGVVRGGPDWPILSVVDIVCEFSHDGEFRRVIAKNVVITGVF
ncbi:MAG: hypothetical protein EOP48_27215 [Sphingobacteriales bacterium]|nr:MAG: hypothetical protein EOP48_27215 [Sphingobacteriales bacterium]